MIIKIKKLLENIMTKSPIIQDASVKDIRDMFQEQRKEGQREPKVRFVATKEGHYYIANAYEWIHFQIMTEMGLTGDTLQGMLYEGGYVWVYKYSLFDYLDITDPSRVFMSNEEFARLFKETSFYKKIKPLVKEIEQSS